MDKDNRRSRWERKSKYRSRNKKNFERKDKRIKFKDKSGKPTEWNDIK